MAATALSGDDLRREVAENHTSNWADTNVSFTPVPKKFKLGEALTLPELNFKNKLVSLVDEKIEDRTVSEFTVFVREHEQKILKKFQKSEHVFLGFITRLATFLTKKEASTCEETRNDYATCLLKTVETSSKIVSLKDVLEAISISGETFVEIFDCEDEEIVALHSKLAKLTINAIINFQPPSYVEPATAPIVLKQSQQKPKNDVGVIGDERRQQPLSVWNAFGPNLLANGKDYDGPVAYQQFNATVRHTQTCYAIEDSVPVQDPIMVKTTHLNDSTEVCFIMKIKDEVKPVYNAPNVCIKHTLRNPCPPEYANRLVDRNGRRIRVPSYFAQLITNKSGAGQIKKVFTRNLDGKFSTPSVEVSLEEDACACCLAEKQNKNE